MADDKNNLLLFYQRPLEPIFTKRDNGKTAFDVPNNFLTERYQPIGQELETRFGGDDVEKRVSVLPITPPDIKFAQAIKRKGAFSLFIQKHKDIAAKLTKLFMDVPTVPMLMSTLAYSKDRLNPYLFQYSLAVAMQHRPDTKDLSVASIVSLFPDQFIDPSVFPEAREEQQLVSQENRMVVDIPMNYTASDREEEHRLAYFREDIGINSMHWHWHLVYPGEGERRVVAKDRRGELFYYMHNQIIARYNVERFCNKLGRVKPLNNLRETIPEGYFPKIIRSLNNRAYPPRVSNAVLADINREETTVELSDLERWRDRIHQAIDQGYVMSSNGQQIPLDETKGIDILGDIVEPSSLSPNRQLYGSLHAEGHNVLGYIHDPENRHLEDYGVIGDVSTSMRDPLFYRWHSFIDQIFLKFKRTLPEYPLNQLQYNDVFVDNVVVQISKGSRIMPNVLLTYWQRTDFDLGTGLDFGVQGNVYAQFTHLQCAPFEYKINVRNEGGTSRRGTCRIFLFPQVDERGVEFTFRDQRFFALELDKFTVNLNPGVNNIRRRSDQSSVTIPYERSFRNLGSQFQPLEAGARAQFQFCGCGWPEHLLLPKGTPEGLKFKLFVMISNYNDDTVNQEIDQSVNCNDSASFCGLRDALYPDKRAMGFPFDRNHSARTLDEFTSLATNMNLGECTIKYSNIIVNRT